MPGDDDLRLAFVPVTEQGKVARGLRLCRRPVGRRRPHQSRPDRGHAHHQPPDRHGLLGAGGDRLAAHSRALAGRGSDPLSRPARLAHRLAQSRAVPPASRPRRGARQAARPPHGGVLPRPRPLQECQRHARSRHRRCAAGGGLRAAEGERARDPISSAGLAATNSPSSPRISRRRRMPCVWRAASAPRSVRPIHVNGHEVTTRRSIGIALGPMMAARPRRLMKNADLALYRAKEDGRNTFRFFEPAMDAALQKRRQLENDLRDALRKNQLYTRLSAAVRSGERPAHRLRGARALVASVRRRDSADHLPADRRRDRPHRAARRVDPADGMLLRHDLAARHQTCRQSVAGTVQDPGRVRPRAARSGRDRTRAASGWSSRSPRASSCRTPKPCSTP